MKKSEYGRQAVASSEDEEDEDEEDDDQAGEEIEEEEEIEKISKNPPLLKKRVIVHGLIARPELNGMEGEAWYYNKTIGQYAVRLDRGEGEESIEIYVKPDNLSEVVEHPESEAAIPAVDIETASCSSSTTTVNAKQSETEILSIMALKLIKDFGFPEIAVPVAEKSLEVSRCTKPKIENRINTHTHTHTQAQAHTHTHTHKHKHTHTHTHTHTKANANANAA